MKYESCRKCGTKLEESKEEDDKCIVCRETIRFVCPECDRKTEPQFNPHIYDKTLQSQTPSILTTGGKKN